MPDVIDIPKARLISITKLKPHPTNIKKHNAEQITGLAELIKLIGFKDPIVVDKNFTIRAGHARLEAATLLGMKKVPYILADKLSKKQLDAFMIMDNRINESPWDTENLQKMMDELKDFDFSKYNMDFSDLLKETTDMQEDEIPPKPVKPVSKKGEMYQLGKHKLLIDDCTEVANYEKLFGTELVDQLNCDPPYGVDHSDQNENLNAADGGNRITKPIENDNITDYRNFYNSFLRPIKFAEHNTVYVFTGGPELHNMRLSFDDCKLKFSTYLQWIKNNHMLSRQDYKGKFETIVYGWKDRHKFYADDFRTTVLEYDKPAANDLHPTMKPIELIVQLIEDGTAPGALVYDPFLGSGTCIIAAEKTGRKCYGMEKDPAYADVIITRWQNLTGKKAVKL